MEIAAQDIGTGAYTVLAMTAADRLGLEIGQVEVRIGDTDLPPAGLAAESSHTASICNAVAKACEEIRARIAHAAATSNDGPFAGRAPAGLHLAGGALRAADGVVEPLRHALGRVAAGALEIHAENVPKGMPPDAMGKIYRGEMAISRGTQHKDATTYAFGAQFVEVRVHARTREIRVPRVVGAFVGTDRQSADGAQPVYGRHDLGHRLRPA